MKLQIEERGIFKHVKLQERRLDIHSAFKLKEKLFLLIQNQGNKNIVLDISNCSFCDASGLSTIVKVHCMCKTAEGMLILTGIQSNIEKMIKICMLHSEWNIAKNINEVETLLKSGLKKGLIPFKLPDT